MPGTVTGSAGRGKPECRVAVATALLSAAQDDGHAYHLWVLMLSGLAVLKGTSLQWHQANRWPGNNASATADNHITGLQHWIAGTTGQRSQPPAAELRPIA